MGGACAIGVVRVTVAQAVQSRVVWIDEEGLASGLDEGFGCPPELVDGLPLPQAVRMINVIPVMAVPPARRSRELSRNITQ